MSFIRDLSVSLQSPPVLSGVVTKQAISGQFKITNVRSILIDVSVASVTHVGTQTITFQTKSLGTGENWVDSKAVTFSSAGIVTISLLDVVAGDQQYLPLRQIGRVVISQTNVGDATTVTAVSILQQDN